jgi:hypothetical protein
MKYLKLTFLFLGLSALTQVSHAQKNEKTLAPEVYLNIPVGNASNIEGIGFSFNGQAQFPIQKTGFNLLLRTGVDFFLAKTNNTYNTQTTRATLDAIPVLVGARYYFNEGFHGDLELGFRYKFSGESKTVFDLAPSIGYQTKTFDPFIRFSTSLLPSSSFVSFGARYQFKI